MLRLKYPEQTQGINQTLQITTAQVERVHSQILAKYFTEYMSKKHHTSLGPYNYLISSTAWI